MTVSLLGPAKKLVRKRKRIFLKVRVMRKNRILVENGGTGRQILLKTAVMR